MANWSTFPAALPGEPKRIVCDAHGGMLRAIEERWPDAELQQCEWRRRPWSSSQGRSPPRFPLRRYALKNRKRLNRLLLLLQLHVNGQDDVQSYTTAIRSWLEANRGRPTTHRRAIADPAGVPSLR